MNSEESTEFAKCFCKKGDPNLLSLIWEKSQQVESLNWVQFMLQCFLNLGKTSMFDPSILLPGFLKVKLWCKPFFNGVFCEKNIKKNSRNLRLRIDTPFFLNNYTLNKKTFQWKHAGHAPSRSCCSSCLGNDALGQEPFSFRWLVTITMFSWLN